MRLNSGYTPLEEKCNNGVKISRKDKLKIVIDQ